MPGWVFGALAGLMVSGAVTMMMASAGTGSILLIPLVALVLCPVGAALGWLGDRYLIGK